MLSATAGLIALKPKPKPKQFARIKNPFSGEIVPIEISGKEPTPDEFNAAMAAFKAQGGAYDPTTGSTLSQGYSPNPSKGTVKPGARDEASEMVWSGDPKVGWVSRTIYNAHYTGGKGLTVFEAPKVVEGNQNVRRKVQESIGQFTGYEGVGGTIGTTVESVANPLAYAEAVASGDPLSQLTLGAGGLVGLARRGVPKELPISKAEQASKRAALKTFKPKEKLSVPKPTETKGGIAKLATKKPKAPQKALPASTTRVVEPTPESIWMVKARERLNKLEQSANPQLKAEANGLRRALQSGKPPEGFLEKIGQKPKEPQFTQSGLPKGVKTREAVGKAGPVTLPKEPQFVGTVKGGEYKGKLGPQPEISVTTTAKPGPKPPKQVRTPETGTQGPQRASTKPPVAKTELDDLDNYAGIRMLPDDVKASAKERVQKTGIRRSQRESVTDYQTRLKNMGLTSKESADPANRGTLTPDQVDYLGHMYDSVDQAAKKAASEVDSLTKAGAAAEDIAKAQVKADTLDQQAVDILTGFTHGKSSVARSLRMTQEIQKGTMDLSGAISWAAKKMGVPKLPKNDTDKIRTAYDKMQAHLADANAHNAEAFATAMTQESKNIFKARRDAAWTRIKEKTSVAGSGIDPTILVDYADIGASYLAEGTYEFGKFSVRLAKEVQDNLKVRLNQSQIREIYNRPWSKAKREIMKGHEYGKSVAE